MAEFVVLGLGSNLGNRAQILSEAIKHIFSAPTALLSNGCCSELFESDALLLPDSPLEWNIPFLNLAVAGQCELSPLELLKAVKGLEAQLGRQARQRWAPREIDIDILSYGNKSLTLDVLRLPHPAIAERPFALWPFAALNPDYPLPSAGRQAAAQTLVFRWGYTRAEIPCKTWKASRKSQDQFRAALPSGLAWKEGPLPRADLVGVINITPDSFSDGGKFTTPEACLAQARELYAHGAMLIDIGAESTRPGAPALDAQSEMARLQPVLEALLHERSKSALFPEISVDTRHPDVAKFALSLGVEWINDVQGFSDKQMLSIAADSGAGLIAMHSLGIPPNKDRILDLSRPAYQQIQDWIDERLALFRQHKIDNSRLILDPGIGFGKNAEQSWNIIANARLLRTDGARLLFGHSRKSYLSLITARPAAERDSETALISTLLNTFGVDYLRVHNVAASIKAMCLVEPTSLPPI
ncbi:MAG: dihydropteroate synthase [Oligoflexia bacterium]|nr:dihydropteroate synthase [Oligoflexia bacterium]